jgi:hypothetical protein
MYEGLGFILSIVLPKPYPLLLPKKKKKKVAGVTYGPKYCGG